VAANRTREPWVIDGMRWLTSVAQRRHAYLAPGLELLEEVQRTGDIFLPSAMLSGHRPAART
jgi:aminopeptidase N